VAALDNSPTGLTPTSRRGLCIRVIGDEVVGTHPLPQSGKLVIGRASGAELRIDHESVSRRHALLHIGQELRLEDLGSVNGTRIGERQIAAGELATIALGEVIELGSVLLVLQRGSSGEISRPVRSRREPAAGAGAEADSVMGRLHRVVDRIAAGTIGVLLLGETGVGKGVLAQELHGRSPRAGKPMMCINCATLAEGLVESELFGHEQGAFTGALRAKPGLLETANGGTVFLDEIGELSLALQGKLLRVLEEQRFMRVGGVSLRDIDVRFIAATNRDLQAEIANRRFRQDLFFRLSGISLLIPPLRERRSEIVPLTHSFVAQASKRAQRATPPRLSEEALTVLQRYDWPGNIRELRNAIERAVLLCSDAILPEHLELERPPASAAPAAVTTPAAADASLPRQLDAVERERILEALSRCGGNQSQAARLLGISRKVLIARLDEYGVPRPRKRGYAS
jgi:DNA-binding NtrC family response regulator